jgi:hypothetical protein
MKPEMWHFSMRNTGFRPKTSTTLSKSFFLCLVFIVFAVSFAHAGQTPNNTNSEKPLISYAAADGAKTMIDINGSFLHQNGVATVILGDNNQNPNNPTPVIELPVLSTSANQVMVDLTGLASPLLDGTHLLTVVTSKGFDEYNLSIGAVGPQGPAGADGAPGTDGADGADGAVGPIGLPGAAGTDGADGQDGADGADGVLSFPTRNTAGGGWRPSKCYGDRA